MEEVLWLLSYAHKFALTFFGGRGEEEEEECSEGIHRTFQNRSEILSAGRIGVVLVLKSPPFWKGLKTRSLVWVFLLLCLLSVNTPVRILRDFQFFMSVACCSRGPNLTHNSYCQCLYSQKSQWFSPTLTNSFPDQSAAPGLLQPSKANGHAAFMALEALHSSTTEKKCQPLRGVRQGMEAGIFRAQSPFLFPHSLPNCLQTPMQFLCLSFQNKYVVVICVFVLKIAIWKNGRMRFSTVITKQQTAYQTRDNPAIK